MDVPDASRPPPSRDNVPPWREGRKGTRERSRCPPTLSNLAFWFPSPPVSCLRDCTSLSRAEDHCTPASLLGTVNGCTEEGLNPCQLAAAVVFASCCPPRSVDRTASLSTSIAKTPRSLSSLTRDSIDFDRLARLLLLSRYPRELRMRKGKEKKERRRGREGSSRVSVRATFM